MKGRAMSEVHDLLLDGVLNANEVVLDAEARTRRWAQQRSHLARVAYLNGVPIEEIARRVGQSSSTVLEWVASGDCKPADGGPHP
jgi:predicted transcriptional regulator